MLQSSALYHEAKATFESPLGAFKPPRTAGLRRGIMGAADLSCDFTKMMENKNSAVKKLTGGLK